MNLRIEQRKFYWKIQHVTENYFKIGYISNNGFLNVSQELYDNLIVLNANFNWITGNTNGGTKEIYHTRFENVDNCLRELARFGIKIKLVQIV